jgi:hypothetical protein
VKVKFNIRGNKQLAANLRRMTTIPKREIDPIMQDALEPMRTDTVQNALVLRQTGTSPGGGHLDQGVVSVPVKESSRTRTTWWVSFVRRARKIAHLVEFGTAPHEQPRRGIMHPGARPKPFFRPAFEGNKGVALSRLGSGLRSLLISRIKR